MSSLVCSFIICPPLVETLYDWSLLQNAVDADRCNGHNEDGVPIVVGTLCVIDRPMRRIAKQDGSLRIAVVNVREHDEHNNNKEV